MLEIVEDQIAELKKLWKNKRLLLHQGLNLAMIVFSALMIWKGLMFLTKSESPVVVVLSGSMEPAFQRGDILFLNNQANPIRVGDGACNQIVAPPASRHRRDASSTAWRCGLAIDATPARWRGGVVSHHSIQPARPHSLIDLRTGQRHHHRRLQDGGRGPDGPGVGQRVRF